ncbi:MAG: hypothetical protein ACN6PJ_14570 [Achromobacter sp.]|uniref:hypothetical protein n=1 Tax=Achromobacter sp. TaxID=134375 RepID=UPI003D00B187
MQENTHEALARELDTERARLRLWREVEPVYQKRYEEALAPLETMEVELKAKLVLCFDHACKQKELTKAERELASELAAQLAQETLFALVLDGTPAECDVERLKALYRKHGGSDFDAEVADELAEMAAMAAASAAAVPEAPDPGPDTAAQLAAAKRELAAVEQRFMARYHFDPDQAIDPADLMEDLAAEIADAEEYIGELEFELSQFVDIQQVKAWLKAMKQQLAATRRREARQ